MCDGAVKWPEKQGQRNGKACVSVAATVAALVLAAAVAALASTA